MSGATKDIRSSQWLLLVVCAAGLLFGGAASADERHRDDRDHRERSHRDHGRREHGHQDYRRNDNGRHDYGRHDGRRGSHHDGRHDRRYSSHGDSRADYGRRDWHYYNGRYWAPPRYRGRECTDRRHHHGVHYHVVARDYYDYYYPRYRYYGSRPLSADASVIISIPLF